MVFFLDNSSLKEIFNSFKSSNLTCKNNSNETTRIKFANGHGAYQILISNYEECKYVSNLNEIYTLIIEPFYERAKMMNISLNIFDRFFKITTSSFNVQNANFLGTQKSLERTDSHDLVIFHISPGPHVNINKNLGDTSHFRSDEYPFPREMSINELVFDFNYFNCFYFDLIKEIDFEKYELFSNL